MSVFVFDYISSLALGDLGLNLWFSREREALVLRALYLLRMGIAGAALCAIATWASRFTPMTVASSQTLAVLVFPMLDFWIGFLIFGETDFLPRHLAFVAAFFIFGWLGATLVARKIRRRSITRSE